MLKTLLQTLVESVFTSKRVEIAQQSLPNGDTVYQYVNNQSNEIIAPFDGWVRVQAQCEDLQAYSGGCLATVTNQRNYPSIVLPVAKGAVIGCNVLAGFTGPIAIWFIHNQTNY